MASNNRQAEITFKANTSQFTNAIKEMNSTMSTLDKELSLVNTEMKGAGESVEGLQKKHDILSQKLEASGTKVENLKAKLEEAKRVFGENSTEVQKCNNQLLTAQNQYARLENQLSQVDNSMEQLNQQAEREQSALGQLENTISQQENALEQLKREYQNVALEQGQSSDKAQDLARQIQDLSSELNENQNRLREVADASDDLANGFDNADEGANGLGGVLEGLRGSFDTNIASAVALGEAIVEFAKSAISFAIDKIKEFGEYLWELPEATEEYRNMMAKLEGSTEQAGYKVSDAKEQYKEFYSYLNDDMAANNCVTNLQKMGLSQEQLNQVSEASIAVWTAYGDSIPIESLTESITETVQVGKVTGNLADALNWAGINEDEFNNKLASCNSEKERAKLITDALNGAYGEGKQKYDELTEAQRENLKSQIELKDTEAKLAEAILPIQTGFTNLKNTILEALTPAIQWVSDKIQGLIDWFNGLSPATQEVITTIGMVTGVVLIIVGVLAGLAVAIGVVSFALGILNINLLPIIVIILAVIAVITLVVLAVKNWGAITDWLSEKWNQFTGWLSELPGKISTWFSQIISNVVSWASQMASNAKTAATNFVNNVVSFIKSLPGKVWTWLSNTVSKVVSWAAQMVGKARKASTDFVNNVVTFIKGLPGKVWTWLSNTVQQAVKFGSNMASKARKAGSDFINNMVTALKGLPGKIGGIFTKAREAVTRKLSEIKSKLLGFKPSWSIPKPKLPHVSVSIGHKQVGELSIPYPQFSVSWNALGGIFTKPTIFSTPNGLQGVGEAGAEAILPLSQFYNHLDNKLESIVRASAIDYDMMTNCFMSALNKLTLTMDAKEVGRLTSRYSEEEINSRNRRLGRFGGDTTID